MSARTLLGVGFSLLLLWAVGRGLQALGLGDGFAALGWSGLASLLAGGLWAVIGWKGSE